MSENKYSLRTVWSDEDREWVAFSPEFEGVSGLGKDPEAAIREARTALELAIETYAEEGWPLPEPQELAAHSGQFRLRLPKSVHGRLAQLAAHEGVSLNAMAVSLITEGLGAAAATSVVRQRIDECVELVRSELAADNLQTVTLTAANVSDAGAGWSSVEEASFFPLSNVATSPGGAKGWRN